MINSENKSDLLLGCGYSVAWDTRMPIRQNKRDINIFH